MAHTTPVRSEWRNATPTPSEPICRNLVKATEGNRPTARRTDMNQAYAPGLASTIPPPYAAPPLNVPQTYVTNDAPVFPRSIAVRRRQPKPHVLYAYQIRTFVSRTKPLHFRFFRPRGQRFDWSAKADVEGYAASARKMRLTLQGRYCSTLQKRLRRAPLPEVISPPNALSMAGTGPESCTLCSGLRGAE